MMYVTTLLIFLPFVLPNLISDGPTNWLLIHQLLPEVDRKARMMTQYMKKPRSMKKVHTGCSRRHGMAEIQRPASWNSATTREIRFRITRQISSRITWGGC